MGTSTRALEEEIDPLEAVFEQMFELIEEQLAEDMLQVVFRTSYLEFAGRLAPRAYMQLMRVALCDVFMNDPPAESIAGKIKIRADKIGRIRESYEYKEIRGQLITYYKELGNPQSWTDHIASKTVQDRAFKRQFRIALSSKNPNAVVKALDSIAERAAPAVRSQQPNVTIMIGSDDIEAEKQTVKMVGGSSVRALTDGTPD